MAGYKVLMVQGWMRKTQKPIIVPPEKSLREANADVTRVVADLDEEHCPGDWRESDFDEAIMKAGYGVPRYGLSSTTFSAWN